MTARKTATPRKAATPRKPKGTFSENQLQFRNYLRPILVNAYPDMSITKESVDAVHILLLEFIAKIVFVAELIVGLRKQVTISLDDLRVAVQAVLPSNIGANADAAGNQAVQALAATGVHVGRRTGQRRTKGASPRGTQADGYWDGAAGPAATARTAPVRREAIIGTTIPPARIENIMRNEGKNFRFGGGSSEYVAGVVEYLADQIFRAAGAAAVAAGRTRVDLPTLAVGLFNQRVIRQVVADWVFDQIANPETGVQETLFVEDFE